MALYMPLFKACTTLRSLTILHAHLMVRGQQKDPLASTKLIETYSQMGCVQSSRRIFVTFSNPDSFMWGVLIKCHLWNGMFREAIFVYEDMMGSFGELSEFIFPSVLRACSAINDLSQGEKVHARIVKSGFESDPIIETSLLSLYGETGCLYNVRKVFDGMSTRDVVSWSSLISNYVRNGHPREGLAIFRKMVGEGLEVDSVTMLSVAEACGELGLPRIGKSSHCYLVRRNIAHDHEALVSSLVAMYGKFGDVCSAENLFYNGVYCNVTSWTALISSYNQNGHYLQALLTFIKMLGRKVKINSVTLMNVICSCTKLGLLRKGKSGHGYVIRNNIELDRDFLRSSLIDLYANCGQIRYARRLFDNTRDKHVVSWNILISGYVRAGMAYEALSLFSEMLFNEILPDSFALASALSACGIIGVAKTGCQIHCLVIKRNLQKNEFLENALIDMYSKCVCINSATRIFHETRKDSIVTWNSMMCGFSQNGYSKEALILFVEMYVKNLDMDEVTLLSAIQACSNLGFIDKAKWIHQKVIIFGVKRDMYIDTALANMYARCGDLSMARKVFDKMCERSIVSWSSMIGSYAMHGYIDDSISLFDRMVELGIKPNNITFMNILSACSHAGYVEKGKFYFNLMVKDFGVKPNSEHYACLVDLLSRSGDLNRAYEVINSMPFPADASIWGALVNGCRIYGRMDFLKSVFKDFINVGSYDTGYYTLLSNVYAEGGEWNEFKMVKSKMRNLGLKKVPGYSMIESNS